MPEPFNQFRINHADKELQKRINPLVDKAKIDLNNPIPPPPDFLKVGSTPVATEGNISMIKGQPKSRKTFFLCMIIASLISKNNTYKPFKGTLPAKKNRVILFDTEQSHHKVQQVAKRISGMSGTNNPGNFDVYSLRQYNSIERLCIIQHVIHHTKDVGFVLIDGIRDLVTQINDETQATGLSTMLLRLTARYKIHISVVLHENKKNSHARGHLGTEMNNKAESVIEIKHINKSSSRVTSALSRDVPFDDFHFTIDENDMPRLDESLTAKSNQRKKKVTHKPEPDELTQEQHTKLYSEIKKQLKGKKLKRNELMKVLKKIISNQIKPMGDTKVRRYLDHFLKENKIIKVGKDKSPKAYYTLP